MEHVDWRLFVLEKSSRTTVRSKAENHDHRAVKAQGSTSLRLDFHDMYNYVVIWGQLEVCQLALKHEPGSISMICITFLEMAMMTCSLWGLLRVR